MQRKRGTEMVKPSQSSGVSQVKSPLECFSLAGVANKCRGVCQICCRAITFVSVQFIMICRWYVLYQECSGKGKVLKLMQILYVSLTTYNVHTVVCVENRLCHMIHRSVFYAHFETHDISYNKMQLNKFVILLRAIPKL